MIKKKCLLDRFQTLSTVDKKWEERDKSNLIKWLLKNSNVSKDRLAAFLGCSKAYLDNKLYRDSFSAYDLVAAAYVCGYRFVLISEDAVFPYYDSDEVKKAVQIDPKDVLDARTIERVKSIREQELIEKRVEYEKLKEEIEKMKREYGFDVKEENYGTGAEICENLHD